ncbi:MAG TPA: acyloxyacyl hydrolase [Ramlibacter sp.]|uniref:acyloxyacyl hydrolase n=1 Tax=Ramlibacter sp. TaxID=1917967 RepID=UPI002D55C2BD|nr:acyloxyacyl hydrolase [Ramlibacter sp.]HZY17414.1 acyloxyacyl hydrolase [Ramlibacter sp.]
MSRVLFLACAVALGVVAAPAGAEGLAPGGAFVQGGGGERDVGVGAVGLLWPWAWRSSFAGTQVTGETELFAAAWRARRVGGGKQTYAQLGLVPLLRLRPGEGRSPWFFEAGIGVSYTDDVFVTPDKTFSTRWNFSDNLGFGRSFGQQRQHEVSLRLQHTSNAGIRKPNPGEDLLLVRYTTRF